MKSLERWNLSESDLGNHFQKRISTMGRMATSEDYKKTKRLSEKKRLIFPTLDVQGVQVWKELVYKKVSTTSSIIFLRVRSIQTWKELVLKEAA